MSDVIIEVSFLMLIIIAIVFIGASEFNRGKIKNCLDIGWYPLTEDNCVSPEEYKLQYNNTSKYQGIKLPKFSMNGVDP